MTSPVRQESKAETRSPPHQYQRHHNPLPPRLLERPPSYCRDILLLLLILILLLLLFLFLLCREASSFCLKLNCPPSSQQLSTTSCRDSAGDTGRPPEDLSASPAALFHLGPRRRRFRVLCSRRHSVLASFRLKAGAEKRRVSDLPESVERQVPRRVEPLPAGHGAERKRPGYG